MIPVEAEDLAAPAGQCLGCFEPSATCSAGYSECLALLGRHILNKRIVVLIGKGCVKWFEESHCCYFTFLSDWLLRYNSATTAHYYSGTARNDYRRNDYRNNHGALSGQQYLQEYMMALKVVSRWPRGSDADKPPQPLPAICRPHAILGAGSSHPW